MTRFLEHRTWISLGVAGVVGVASQSVVPWRAEDPLLVMSGRIVQVSTERYTPDTSRSYSRRRFSPRRWPAHWRTSLCAGEHIWRTRGRFRLIRSHRRAIGCS